MKLINLGKASRLTKGASTGIAIEMGVPPFNKVFICIPCGH